MLRVRVHLLKTADYSRGSAHLSFEWPYVDIDADLHNPRLPEVIKEANVHHFSIVDRAPWRRSRAAGLYELGQAQGLVDSEHIHDSDNIVYEVKITARDLRDAVKLYRCIRAGTITPVESWENPQIVSSARELRDLWREMWRLISRNIRDWIRNCRAGITRRFRRKSTTA